MQFKNSQEVSLNKVDVTMKKVLTFFFLSFLVHPSLQASPKETILIYGRHASKKFFTSPSKEKAFKVSSFLFGNAIGAGVEKGRRIDGRYSKLECDHMCFKVTTVLSPFIFKFPILPIFSGRLVGSEVYDYFSPDPKDSTKNGLKK